jgi:hypothetical protein
VPESTLAYPSRQVNPANAATGNPASGNRKAVARPSQKLLPLNHEVCRINHTRNWAAMPPPFLCKNISHSCLQANGDTPNQIIITIHEVAIHSPLKYNLILLQSNQDYHLPQYLAVNNDF